MNCPKFKIHNNILRNQEGRDNGNWSDPLEDEAQIKEGL